MIGIICAMQIEADGIIARSEQANAEEIAGMKLFRQNFAARILLLLCVVSAR